MKHKATWYKQKYTAKIPVISRFHIPHQKVQLETLGFAFLEDQINILLNTSVWVFVSTLPFFPSFDFLHTYLIKQRLIQSLKERLAFQLKKMGWHSKFRLDLLQIQEILQGFRNEASGTNLWVTKNFLDTCVHFLFDFVMIQISGSEFSKSTLRKEHLPSQVVN